MMFGSYVYSIADNVTIHPLRLGLNEDHELFARSGNTHLRDEGSINN
jgi:hypothetical protein